MLSILPALSSIPHLIIHSTFIKGLQFSSHLCKELWWNFCNYSHFIDEGTSAQRHFVTYPRSRSTPKAWVSVIGESLWDIFPLQEITYSLRHFWLIWYKALVTQWCMTLCDLVDCNWLVSSVPEILQARILEWIAFLFSRRFSQLRGWTHISCIAGKFFTVWVTREAQFDTDASSNQALKILYSFGVCVYVCVCLCMKT